jgi:hypothetical protein
MRTPARQDHFCLLPGDPARSGAGLAKLARLTALPTPGPRIVPRVQTGQLTADAGANLRRGADMRSRRHVGTGSAHSPGRPGNGRGEQCLPDSLHDDSSVWQCTLSPNAPSLRQIEPGRNCT